MFRLNPDPTFTARVPLSVPGVEKPLLVAFVFKHKTKAGVEAWLTGMVGKADVDALHEVIAGWSDVVDTAGEQVPYSHTALHDLLQNYPAAKGEIFEAYLGELTKAKAKN